MWRNFTLCIPRLTSDYRLYSPAHSPCKVLDKGCPVRPFPQIDNIGAMVIVWRVRGKTIRSVLCSIACNNCAQCNEHTHTHMNRPVLWIGFCLTGPMSLCLDHFCLTITLHSCAVCHCTLFSSSMEDWRRALLSCSRHASQPYWRSLKTDVTPIFGPFLLRPNGWMHQDATWYGGIGVCPGDFVLDMGTQPAP